MPERGSFPELKIAKDGKEFLHMLEVFVGGFIQLAQATNEEARGHCSRALLHGIHGVFPPPNVTGHNSKDPISKKNYSKEKEFETSEKKY